MDADNRTIYSKALSESGGNMLIIPSVLAHARIRYCLLGVLSQRVIEERYESVHEITLVLPERLGHYMLIDF